MEDSEQAVLEWEDPADSGHVTYYLNKTEIGRNDEGFSAVLAKLNSLHNGTELMIRYELMITPDGGPLDSMFPFYHRITEFEKLVRQKQFRLSYEVKTG